MHARKEQKSLERRQREIEKKNASWYDPIWEKRFTKIAGKYVGKSMFGYFLFDALACIPILLYEGSNGFTTDLD